MCFSCLQEDVSKLCNKPDLIQILQTSGLLSKLKLSSDFYLNFNFCKECGYVEDFGGFGENKLTHSGSFSKSSALENAPSFM